MTAISKRNNIFSKAIFKGSLCFNFTFHKLLFFFIISNSFSSNAQIVINEGCNKNYLSHLDENNESSDWIEIFNSGNNPINLVNYALSDKLSNSIMWKFPDFNLNPGDHQIVYCSGKDRFLAGGFQFGLSQQNFNPITNWNTHNLISSFNWDGVSNIILNVCSYSNVGYTENSVFYQTATSFPSTLVSFIDGSPAACSSNNGVVYNQRPNLKLNGVQIGTGTITNATTDYPAPYGNWYWGARHQMLILADELINAGLSAGPINSISFNVASTTSEFYSYVDFSLLSTNLMELSSEFLPEQGTQFHTNFKLDGDGETVYLFSPAEVLVSELKVDSPQKDISTGHTPDASGIVKWMAPTPGQINETSEVYSDTLIQPQISERSGIYSSTISISILNPNSPGIQTKVVYTLDGTTPTVNSSVYTNSLSISANTVLRASVFPINTNQGVLPSNDAVETYLFNVTHNTPILLVTTDNNNLYGSTGIFDNYNSDWIKPAHAAYLDSTLDHPLIFQTKTAMRPDGGAGGSRSQPQHSFRLSFDHGTLGYKPIQHQLIPDRKDRFKYSDIYLRNGSNQYLTFPYKDASQVRMMSEGTNNYYSSFQPVTVYVNGQYFGLYELREKFNKEYFEIHDGANQDSIEIMSLSYFYNLVLRALEGDVNHFWDSYNQFLNINPINPDYFSKVDEKFDLKHYSDYIIAESFMGNVDWPGNNIKIYRSDKTKNRWRFGLIDLELSMQPNGWSSCTDNHIAYMRSQDPANPYIHIWQRSISNNEYLRYFINRYADLLNTSYQSDTLLYFENKFYNSMVQDMPDEYQRWGDPTNIPGQMDAFFNNHLIFRQQLMCRGEIVRSNLQSEFNLEKQIDLNLDVFPQNTGLIKLNTIQPKEYPWSGIYYDGVAVKMEAVANSGFQFSHWIPNEFIVDTLNPIFEGNIDSLTSNFTAVFKEIPVPVDGPDINFTLYPNPANDAITLAHDNKTIATGCIYRIFDLNGRIVASGKVENEVTTTTISLNKISASCYFINISKENEILDNILFIKN